MTGVNWRDSDKIRVKVGQDCIDKGVPGNARKCPVHLALGSYFNNKVSSFYIHRENLIVLGKRAQLFFRAPLPAEACRFIADFDAKKQVEPIEFVIGYPGLGKAIKPEYLIEND